MNLEPDDDRILRIAFEETQGGKTPPDLTARILAAAQGEPFATTRATSPQRAAVSARYGLGLAAGALVATVAGWWLQRVATRSERAALHVAVAEGSLRHRRDASETLLAAGSDRLLAVARGDRLHAADGGTTQLDLFELGGLRLAAGTLLEVKDMETTNKGFGTGMAIGALTVAVLGGSVWVMQGSHTTAAQTGDSVELRAGKSAVASLSAEELARLREREGSLTKELDAMQAQVKELQERLARRPAEPASRPAEKSPTAEPSEPEPLKAARFGYPGLEEALAEIDWKKSGAAIHKMAGMLAELQAALAKGEEIPLDLLGRIQSENGLLIQQAMALVKHGVPGTGINGAYTHPVVVANQLNSALADAKVPLDDRQMAALNRLATQFAGSDDLRRGNQAPDALALRGVLDELALKDRFYDEVKNLLTQDQRDLFFKPGTGDGLMGSMFSSSLMIAPLMKPVPTSDAGDYAQQVARDFGGALALDAVGREQLAGLTAKWADRMPKDFFQPTPMSSVAGSEIPKLTKAQMQVYAEQQVGLYEEMLRTLTLSPEQQKKLRGEIKLRMPLVSGKKK